ncbi:TfoX/Sxy family protein [Blastococcus brunescens]|uniref:TfoX/Sxy family protein n=1 Tax=Blastococcus brunescens TaxID=1564165 RepID=A0ABZ1AWT3_9ACTN|nr:TfoX/Sxy family protein [Blastococcus sp. BMG 8361]WRL63026.1 TfoX/Sxy family protein [Blastococcus sp. BMG 8361]
MADSWEDLVERTCDADVTSGSMFGCQGLRTGRRFFAIWWAEQLVVKLPPERLQELVATGQAEHFEPMPGRRMNGWVVLGESVSWDPVAAEARAWVESQQ